MSDNLMFYINKLSYLIVAQELESCNNQSQKKKGDAYFKKCLRKVRQKGCDVILKKCEGTPIHDPCLTDYGGNWSPITLITDYGRDLEAEGKGKLNELLVSCIKTLEEKQYNCVNDLLKLCLLLKKPLNTSSEFFKSDVSLLSSHFLHSGVDSLSCLESDYSSESVFRSSSLKKALKYEESWTKHFDHKFQLLGEFSKKNLAVPEKASLKTIFSSKTMLALSDSHTNSFDFTDFLCLKNCKTEESLFSISSSSDYINENPLLDSFVDQPITHKLPSLRNSYKYSCKSGFLERLSAELNTTTTTTTTAAAAAAAALQKDQRGSTCSDVNSRKSSMIELKRSSNCSHSFSVLYDKPRNSQTWEFKSSESFRGSRNKVKFPSSNSKEIILGLWEQEKTLIEEFVPELSASFPSLRMITLNEFVEDVKFLFTGINSNTFMYDAEKKSFNMVYGTCLDDVTPESLFHFSKEFIEIGNCYMKLMSRVKEKSFDTCTSVSQVFWKSIFDYLELHYSLVVEIPATTNLMALKSCTRDMHGMIKTVASICKVEGKGRLPEGGELLTYLLDVAEKISKECVINVVFGIILNCCSVYFLCILQNWMFKGQLDCQSNEFFVDYHRQKVKLKSRCYYKSFFLVDEKIPKFLKGYEESFYNCGKSIHFLKLFNAEDIFCQLLEKGDFPTMKLCFSDDQLEALEKKFKEYEERILKQCGERVTIKMLKEKEKEKERRLLEFLKESKYLQEKKQEEIRAQKREEAKALKEEQNKQLDAQRAAIDAEKERKKQEEEKEKKEDAMQRLSEKRENLLNEEKNRLQAVYGEMMDNLDKRILVAEARKENLEKILSTEQEANVMNCNKLLLDEEGNVSAQLDVNSNSSSKYSEGSITPTNRNVSAQLDVNSNSSSKYSEGSITPTNRNMSAPLDINSNSSSKNLERSSIPTGCNVSYDENSNPCMEIGKAVSFRTAAAEEAVKNKCRVLKSEFTLPVAKDEKPPKKRRDSELERNRRKVMQSEYNILLKTTSSSLSSETFQSATPSIVGSESSFDDVRNSPYEKVDLKRKVENMDLSEPPNVTIEIPSSESCLASLDSAENLSNEDQPPPTTDSASLVTKEKFQDALNRDTEMFRYKTSHQDIFCCLKVEEELNNLPCTDYLKLQRYLRKSALVPLRIQEKLANDALLKHFLKNEDLLSHLNSLRGFFFFNDGEFGRCFTHNTFRSLAKCTEPKQFFERSNLSDIVNEALNYTIHSLEPNSKNLSFQIVKMPPFLNHSSHEVLSPFELSYKVDWPLNLVLTEKVLAKYKMVFKFLLKLKRINWTLNENFLYLNSLFKGNQLDGKAVVGSSHYHKIQIFRHAMTQVMITLDDYIFSNGIQCPWIFFSKDLETTENIDHLYQKHVKYIKDVLMRCFLSKNSEDLLDCIYSLIELALKFHYTTKSAAMELRDGKYKHPKFSVLKGTFHEFCSVMKTFLKTLKDKIYSNEVHRSHYVLIEKFDLKLT